MHDLHELFNCPTLYSSICDVSSGKFLPWIEPVEANNTISPCENPFRRNIVTCKDDYIDEFIQEVDGLDLNSKLNQNLLKLPSYIPILDIRTKSLSDIPSNLPFVGISLTDILSTGIIFKAGSFHEQQTISIRKNLIDHSSFKDKKTILFLTGPDTLIEWVWYKRTDCNFFSEISNLNLSAVGGFNFSVIGGECPFSQALNIKKSLFSSHLLAENGINPIPHVYAITKHQLNRWVDWFVANPKVRLFSINCQLQKKQQDIALIIQNVKFILAKVPYLHVILQGFPIDEIEKFEIHINHIHFADKLSVKYAQLKREFFIDYKTSRLETRIQTKKDFQIMAIENMNIRHIYIEYIKSKVLENLYKKVG